MAENDNEIMDCHAEDEKEKTRACAIRTHSYLESLTPSDRDGHSSTQSSHRLLAYSDALISIIATVMILPVAHTKIQEDEELTESLQQLISTKVAVYLMTFLIVTVAWAAHIRLFQVIEHIDDCLALLNLACMMLITFLPYTFSLMATFPENTLGILLFCTCVIVIGMIQAIIVVYGFSRPFLLNEQIQMSENPTFYKWHILKVISKVPVLCMLAVIFSFIFSPVSYVLLAIVIFLRYISLSARWCYGKATGRLEEPTDSMAFYTYHPDEPLSKERVEAFSDGVYAIVATLLILDICEDNVPDPKVVQEKFSGSLVDALKEFGPEFLAYFGSFATVGLLWFVHHSLFLHVTRATHLMGLFNTFSLAFVGGLPLAYQLTHEFARNSRNELEAIQISCVIIFFAGLFQLAIWVTALFGERSALHPYVRFAGRDHAFMFAKLALYPCVALGTFVLTCVLSRFSAPIFHLMEITVPFVFLLLRLLVSAGLSLLRRLLSSIRRAMRSPPEDEDPRQPLSEVDT
ncbi:endosomal/lysosomal potassium channel TMEM175 isoform X1 [Anguilla anguilla]|uniref:endosomal/lysosomal potassium channel TMEM175 isoform X1 n=1 Tax=Anguilla anguilla TaxID=7936 RepID=UPI0015A7B4E8|nr:endosomal/lysosomal potassium channel TMEM175 isoform X1 [Anguilla anguilla]